MNSLIRCFQDKKLLCLMVMSMFTLSSYSQSNFELGIRLGDQPGEAVAIDMTLPIKAVPRFHPTIYLQDNGLAVGGYFDWMFAVVSEPQGLKLYPGIGPEVYFFNGFELGVAGDFGIEYTFDIPLTVGIDWRPGIILTESLNLHTNNVGISVRYWFQNMQLKRVN